MSSPLSLLRRLLELPGVYLFFQNAIGGKESRSFFVNHYVKACQDNAILDIGCGPGDILAYLPDVRYVGFDMSEHYIRQAQKRFGNRGVFFCQKLDKDSLKPEDKFDIVLATGILHHLNDDEAIKLFELAKEHLKPSGRLITTDGCYTPEQSGLARFLISLDRGQYVRPKNDYIELARRVFPTVNATVHHNQLKIPYTHLIMEAWP